MRCYQCVVDLIVGQLRVKWGFYSEPFATIVRSGKSGNHLLGRSEFVWCRERTTSYLGNHFAAAAGSPLLNNYI